DRSQMQFARTRVRVMNSRETMAAENSVEFPDKRRQVFRIDRGIFNDRHWLRVSREVGKQAQSRFAKIPDPVLVRAPNHRIVVPETGTPQVGFKTSGEGNDLLVS